MAERVRVKVDEKPKAKRESVAAERVRDISVMVYKDRLGPGGAERMIADDGDGGKKLRQRAASYDQLTRVYMRILNVK